MSVRTMGFREGSGKKGSENDPYQVWSQNGLKGVENLERSLEEVFSLLKLSITSALLKWNCTATVSRAACRST